MQARLQPVPNSIWDNEKMMKYSERKYSSF